MNEAEIQKLLRETNEAELARLYEQADAVRRNSVGDAVHLRGLIEISNYCERQCAYCGLRAGNSTVTRYRMEAAEILDCAREAHAYGYGTVVMQSGEHAGIERDWMAALIRAIKSETPLAVTLSLGERDDADYAAWREAGADRYLLRFETSDPALFAAIHPAPKTRPAQSRIEILRRLRELGYEIGSGVMAGIPGQSYASLARDLLTFQELDLDMIGIGPYIAHPRTPLAQGGAPVPIAPEDQAPNTECMTYKMVALTRILCPEANIPSTSALATVNRAEGRELGLQRGANVVMPNLTPAKYRALYEIYPAKACIQETAEQCRGCLRGRIASLGRSVGIGPGGRRRATPAALR